MSYDDSETYTLQMLYGVLPEDLWHHAKESGKDSFLGYSKSQKRLSKRKFRKLTDSVTIMWLKINRYLKATISNE
jgi:hypothetical protein